MAKRTVKVVKKRKWKRWVALTFIVALLLFNATMFLQANVVHVRRATVRLNDLPPAFEGTTILYASDIDIGSELDCRRMIGVFESLKDLNPDVLILGGDYVSPTIFERLNQDAISEDRAADFFASLKDFPTSLGKFAISGDNDVSEDALKASLSEAGIRWIEDNCIVLQKGDSAIGLVGVGTNTASLSSLVANLNHEQCVIAVAHSPSQFVDIRVTEASNGGSWADLLLAGHTHGGQIVLFGRSVLDLNAQEKQRIAGWYGNSLVTTGIGCECLNLRFGTSSEVWLITLEKAGEVRMDFDD